MKRDPTIKIITLGFGSLVALTGVVIFVVLIQMRSTITQTSELVNITYAKAAHAHAMREYIRLRGQAIINMYLTDDFFEREEIRLARYDLALKYKNEVDAFIAKGVSADEQIFFDRIAPLLSSARDINDETAELMLEDVGQKKERKQIILSIKAREPLLEELNKLVRLQEKKAHQVLADTTDHAEKVRVTVIVLPITAAFIGLIIAFLVIRESRKKNLEMRYRASHDSLTQLVNRDEFERQLELALSQAKEDNTEHVLCFLDLDQFKIVNDTCGHNAGDTLLQHLTQVIHKKVRKIDTLGRIGGDEFGLLVKDCTIQRAIELTEGLVKTVKEHKFNWEGRTFNVGVSIGLVSINSRTESVSKAMSQADVACYAAKDMGRNRIHVYEINDHRVKSIHKELSWVADIGKSLAENRFVLYAQSIVSVQARSQKQMYEILLRMKGDAGEIISPDAFIPAAERFNLMQDVDHWVIEQAFKVLSDSFSKNNNSSLMLFINVSANSLTDNKIKNLIQKNIKSLKIPPDSLCFEITETTAIGNLEKTIEFMSELHKLNCHFALDDFGSGMSSFAYLRNLPVDYVKIDGNFVKNIANDTTDQAMVSAINQIGKTMKIKTIAEHVEDKQIMQKIEMIGVDYAQGFHISKPQPIADAISSIAHNVSPDVSGS